MAGGNVTAMMMCNNWGKVRDENNNTTNKLGFSSCDTTDNVTWSKGFCTAPWYSCDENLEYISLQELLTNKWILVDSITVGFSNSTHPQTFLFTFYKVSSD